MLKIQRLVDGGGVVFALSGRIEAENLAQLDALFQAERQRITLDLKEVNLVSREVVTYLARCKEGGIGLNNCPAYIREWIARERGQG